MKVSECKGCPMVRRYVWSQRHEPRGYHAIGFSHAYHYCLFRRMRCLDVKKCDQKSKLLDDSANQQRRTL